MPTMIPIYKPKSGSTAQSYWINFSDALSMDTWPEEELIKTYNASIVRNNGEPCISFQNAQDATLFILRWS